MGQPDTPLSFDASLPFSKHVILFGDRSASNLLESVTFMEFVATEETVR